MELSLKSLIIFCIVISFSGCLSFSERSSQKEEVTDMLGREVTFPRHVDKIVGVGPGSLRLLVYMDLANNVSGIEDIELKPGRPYMFAHPELAERPVIGPYMGGDSELIAVNNPDIIFMSFASVSEANELQDKSGIPVIVLNFGNLHNNRDMFFRALSLIGRVTGKTSRADSLKFFIENQIGILDSITSDIEKFHKPKAYIGGVSYRGAHGISSTEAYYSPFCFVNAKNVAKEVSAKEPLNTVGTYVDIEQIINWNPDFLFVDAAGLELIRPDIDMSAPLGETLDAIKSGNVYSVMPHNWYATNFENVLANAWFVGKVMYPDAFKKIDFRKRIREIYRFMVGKDVYDQMKKTYYGWEKL